MADRRPPPLRRCPPICRGTPAGVERVDRVSRRESPAMVGSLPYPHHLAERKRTGKRTKRSNRTFMELKCRCWSLSIGGEVVARCGDDIAQSPTRWPPSLSSWLLVRWWRSGERWRWCGRWRQQTEQEGRRGTGEEVGGIPRPGSLSSRSVPSPFPSLLAFVLSIYIIRYI